MAVDWKGTLLTGNANDEAVDLGATVPSVTVVTGVVHKESKTVSVLKSTVDDASEITTFNALVVAVDVLLNATVTNDFIASNTVDAYGTLSLIEETTVKYTDAAPSYSCRVDIFTKVS